MLYNATISLTSNGNVKVEGHDWISRGHIKQFGTEWGQELSDEFDYAEYGYGIKIFDDGGDGEGLKGRVADSLSASGKTRTTSK